MRKLIIYSVFILLEMLLFTMIVFLGFKILNLLNSNVKGIQYINKIEKENVIFNKEGKLKYFYEPKPNNIEIWNPDWLGYEVKNTINNDSLNERYNYSTNKKENTYRIITLGDSFTFGFFVNTKENYSEMLEDLLNSQFRCKDKTSFEVINLGVYGYDIEYTIERFINRGLKYKPDLVIWLINQWNFDLINEIKKPIVDKMMAEGVPSYNSKTGVWEASEVARKEVVDKYGLSFILDYQRGLLKKIERYYLGKLLFISFPSFFNEYRDVVNNVYKSNSNYFYYDNLVDVWNDKQYKLLDNHPNKDGHAAIARDLYDYLRNKHFTDCN